MRCPAALDLSWDEGSGPPPLRDLARQLEAFSPSFAYAQDRPGTLWIEAAGLGPQEGSTAQWVERVQQHLKALGWCSSAVWGCGAYAAALLAQALPEGQRLMVGTAHQSRRVASLSITFLGLGDAAEQGLQRLGLRVIGDLRRLPRQALEARYGKPLRDRLRLLAGAEPNWILIGAEKPLSVVLPVDAPLEHVEALIFLVKSVLARSLAQLAEQGQACRALVLSALDERQRRMDWRFCPARPSLNEEVLLDLLRLRLERVQLQSPLQRVELTLKASEANQEQLSLFAAGRRDLRRSDEGLDRLRAELGQEWVYRAELQARYHPQEAVRWRPHEGAWPRLQVGRSSSSWVRRLLAAPRPVEGPKAQGSWSVLGEAVTEVGGPYPLQQGWWRRLRVEDEYLVRTQSGRVFWLLHDRLAQRWLLIGWLA